MEKRTGGGISEALDGRASAVAGIVAALSVEERARLSGVYHAQNVGPLEHERGAYVATRDALEALRFRERQLATMVRDARRAAPKGLRKLVLGIAAAIGLTMALTPAMAGVVAEHARTSHEVAVTKARLDAFVLEEKWADVAPNLVTTVGGNLGLDTILAGSSYTTVGPYLFLINTNASAAAIGDTMGSHAGWLEVGTTNLPTYTSPRKTVAFSSASAKSKAASSASSFAMTGAGTVGGCGLVLGSGAVSTIDSTAGTLYSAGAFTGGSKVVANGDTLNVTYTATI